MNEHEKLSFLRDIPHELNTEGKAESIKVVKIIGTSLFLLLKIGSDGVRFKLGNHKERSWVKNGRGTGTVGNPHDGEILSNEYQG